MLLMLLANLGVYAWRQGHLEPLLGAGTAEREPERLQRQVAPERVQLSR